MTCIYQQQYMNTMDTRALMSIDNNPEFQLQHQQQYHHQPQYQQLSSDYGDHVICGLGLGVEYEAPWFDQTPMDLDLDIGDDGGLLNDFQSPSFAAGLSPVSQSSCLSNSSSSNGSIFDSSVKDGGKAKVTWRSVAKATANREEKICGVCGDKALGFNFDAISCESCKAFFRRNAPKGLSYFKCPYDERCKMDTANRRFCKRCRLKKCFQIGMKKEYILTEEEKATKRRKIEDNRFLKKVCTANNKTINANAPTTTTTTTTEQMSASIIEHPGYLAAPDWSTAETKWQPTPVTSSSSSSSSSSASNWPPTMMTIDLSDEDAATIRDLRVAYHNSLIVTADKAISPPPPPRQGQGQGQGTNLTDLVNIAELSVRRVIAMVKQVTSFRSLPQVEQIHLLKGGSIELLIIRSVITFDAEKQHFLDPVDQEETRAMRLDQLRSAETGLGLFEEHMKFIRSLASDLRADETTLILLLVISLFSPDRDNLTWKGLVSREQEKYSLLLKSYLESIHPLPVARLLYPKLLMKLTDIRNLNEEHSQVLLKVKPEGIHPLMKEVLDLSS